jgi:hypothetical protein
VYTKQSQVESWWILITKIYIQREQDFTTGLFLSPGPYKIPARESGTQLFNLSIHQLLQRLALEQTITKLQYY